MSKQLTIKDLLMMFLHHIKLIILLTVVGAILAFLYVSYMVKPMYSTSALILVRNAELQDKELSTTQKTNTDKVNVSDITSSVTLANTCATIFRVDPEMSGIANGTAVSITPVEDSYLLQISVTSGNKKNASTVANALVEKAPDVYIKYFGEVGEVKKVQEAGPAYQTSPNKSRYVIIGALLGLVLSLIISFLLEIIDTTIKPGDDLYKMYEVPVFGQIVDFESEGGAKKK